MSSLADSVALLPGMLGVLLLFVDVTDDVTFENDSTMPCADLSAGLRSTLGISWCQPMVVCREKVTTHPAVEASRCPGVIWDRKRNHLPHIGVIAIFCRRGGRDWLVG
jgi:hypothetical protein